MCVTMFYSYSHLACLIAVRIKYQKSMILMQLSSLKWQTIF